MRTMCSRKIFTKKCRQQQIFDSDLKGAWHNNHVTFTPIAQHFMLYCRLIYMLSILRVRLTIKVKVRIPESFKVRWYLPPPPQKKKKNLGRVTFTFKLAGQKQYEKHKLINAFSNFLGRFKKSCFNKYFIELACLVSVLEDLFLFFFYFPKFINLTSTPIYKLMHLSMLSCWGGRGGGRA